MAMSKDAAALIRDAGRNILRLLHLDLASGLPERSQAVFAEITAGLFLGAMLIGAIIIIGLIGKNLNKHLQPCYMCGHHYYEENLRVITRICPICLEYMNQEQMAKIE
jgi:hypothetical protein